MKPFVFALLFAAAVGPANAQSAPRLDYRSTCKATPAVGMDHAATVASCLADEENARGALPPVWAKSSRASRAACVAETTQGGLPSYVELLTCLQGNLIVKAR
ncbi:MAG: hypothetical protein U1E30_01355 [Rhodoblastus sp.]